MKLNRIVAATMVVGLFGAGFVACGEHACADTVVVSYVAKSSGGGSKSPGASKSPGPSKSSGASSKSSGSKGSSKTSQQAAATKNSKPSSKPDAATAQSARSQAPTVINNNTTIVSNVTGRTYGYHSFGYYMTPGYVWDIYDPMNPYNYFYMVNSPYYGMHYNYAVSCGGPQKQINEDKNNINITIDNDGKVTQASDKNQQDPDVTKQVANDTAPTTTDPPVDDTPTTNP